VSVGATDPYDLRAWFSNWGESLDVCAPGLDVLSLRASGTSLGATLGDYYTRLSGTSMACPHAVGTLALLIAEHPTWPESRIVAQLVGTCDNIDASNPSYAGLLGFGRINGAKALGGTADAGSRLTLARWRADELVGDGGPGFEPGEEVAITATLKYYLSTMADLGATLSTADAAVSRIGNGSVDFGTLQWWGAVHNASAPFVFDISPDCPRMHSIGFDLALTAGAAEHHYELQVPANMYPPGWPVAKGPWSFGNPIIADVDGDGKPEVVINSDLTHVLKADGADLHGWPVQAWPIGYTTIGNPVVGDVDGDGTLDVVTAMRRWGLPFSPAIGAWRKDGSPLPGFPIYLQWDSVHQMWPQAVTLANLDGKPGLDIIVIASDGINWPSLGHVEIYRKDGTPRAGWPPAGWLVTGSLFNSRVAVGDINGDRMPELVMAEGPSASFAPPRLWAWRVDGSVVPGFPVTLGFYGDWVRGGPELADINEDGRLEIVVGLGETMWVVGGNGMVLPSWGWPQTGEFAAIADLDGDGHLEVITYGATDLRAFRSNGSLMWSRYVGWGGCEPAVGDIDGDGRLEVVVRDEFDYLHAFRCDGTPVPVFPLEVGAFGSLHNQQYQCGVAITDIDADGYTDLITGSSSLDSYAYVFWTNCRYSAANVPWPMQGGNPRNDGVYAPPPKHKKR
jgi:hypothetical protein